MVHEILGEPMFKPAPHRPRGIPRRKPFGTLVVPLLWVGKIVEKSWLVIEKLWIPSELAVQELLALAWQRGDQSAPPLLDAVGVGTLDQDSRHSSILKAWRLRSRVALMRRLRASLGSSAGVVLLRYVTIATPPPGVDC